MTNQTLNKQIDEAISMARYSANNGVIHPDNEKALKTMSNNLDSKIEELQALKGKIISFFYEFEEPYS